MKTRHSVFFKSALVLFVFGIPTIAQNAGSIHGRVVGESGVPINGAKVNASLVNGRSMMKLVRYVETDQEGHFVLDGLKWGNYRVFAMKRESGYPDMGLSFYGSDVPPTAVITPSSAVAELRIQLGPKAGTVTGSITNAADGAPLNASLKLSRANSPSDWLSTSVPSVYRTLIPSSIDVLFEVSAPGFRTWSLDHPIRLEPGAELRLDVAMQPSHDPSLRPSKFLVPEDYVGWLLLEYNVKGAQPTPTEEEVKTFKFPLSGALETSSAGPDIGAEDEFFYYSDNGSMRKIPGDYRNGTGAIWGQYVGTRNGALSQFGFFVGSEDQYKKYQSRMTHPGRIPAP